MKQKQAKLEKSIRIYVSVIGIQEESCDFFKKNTAFFDET